MSPKLTCPWREGKQDEIEASTVSNVRCVRLNFFLALQNSLSATFNKLKRIHAEIQYLLHKQQMRKLKRAARDLRM